MIMQLGILAEASNDVITWGIILVLSTIAVNLWTIFATRRVQKREVTFPFEPASKTEFEKHIEWNRREHENLFSKIGGVDRGHNGHADSLRAQISAEVSKVHDRVNVIDNRMGGIGTAVQMQGEELTEIKRDIKTLIARKA